MPRSLPVYEFAKVINPFVPLWLSMGLPFLGKIKLHILKWLLTHLLNLAWTSNQTEVNFTVHLMPCMVESQRSMTIWLYHWSDLTAFLLSCIVMILLISMRPHSISWIDLLWMSLFKFLKLSTKISSIIACYTWIVGLLRMNIITDEQSFWTS